MAKGDPHYTTFDGAHLELYEDCKYLMAASRDLEGQCRFKVEVKNELRLRSHHPDKAFARLVDFILPGETIRIMRGKRVYVNGGEMELPFHTPFVNVTLSEDNYVTVTSLCGVTVQFDGLSQARVITPATFRNGLHGLCGNCDGNGENDIEVHGKPFFEFGSIEAGFRALGHAHLVPDDSDRPSEEQKCIPGEH